MILRGGFEFAPGYRLKSYLGKGQFGEVWKASGPGGVMLAVKFVSLEKSSGRKEFAAIRRIKSIRHANLMPITGIWQLDQESNVLPEPPDDSDQTVDFLQLESNDGSGFDVRSGPPASLLVVGMALGDASLEKHIPEKGDKNPPAPVPPQDLLRYTEGAARGLDFLNAPKHDLGAGLVSLQHCDVKPANIVVIGDSAVVCDFGLARVLKRSEATMDNAAGTPAYMSPESINGMPSQNSDQYSLAVSYYQLRTGKLPMATGSVAKVLQSHLSGELLFTGVPEMEREILRRATHLQWQERYPSNSAMVDALRVALAQQGINTAGTGTSSPPPPQTNQPDDQADGPAIRGYETYDSEELTDAVVKHSKGGSPIISGNSSGSSLPIGQPAQAAPNESGTNIFGANAAASYAPSTDSIAQPNEIDFAGQDAGLANAPQSALQSPTSTWKQPKLLATVGTAVVAATLGGAFWFTRDQPSPAPDPNPIPQVVPDQTNSFAQAKALLNQGTLTTARQNEAIDLYRSAKKTNSELDRVAVELSRDQHEGAVESLIAGGTSASYLSTGYDQEVRRWKPAKKGEMTLDSVVLGNATDKFIYRENVQLSVNQNMLFAAAGSEVIAWDISRLNSIDTDAFPIQRRGSWTVASEVLALAVHPTERERIVVGLDDQSAWVIDTSTSGDAAVIAQTGTSDFISQIRFDPSGKHCIVRQEGGDIVIYDWSSLSINQADESSAPVLMTGISSTRTIEVPPPQSAGVSTQMDFFFAGDEQGVLSAYEVLGGKESPERRWFADKVHQSGITTLKSTWRDDGTVVLASGDEQGVVAVHCLQTMPDKFKVQSKIELPVDLAASTAGLVRCLTFDDSGQWLAAGVGNDVWVASLSGSKAPAAAFSVGSTSVDSVLIDEERNLLVLGCGDGMLATLDWSHCRLRALAGPVRVDGIKPTTPKPKQGPATQLTAL